jgi:hypothetical protein
VISSQPGRWRIDRGLSCRLGSHRRFAGETPPRHRVVRCAKTTGTRTSWELRRRQCCPSLRMEPREVEAHRSIVRRPLALPGAPTRATARQSKGLDHRGNRAPLGQVRLPRPPIDRRGGQQGAPRSTSRARSPLPYQATVSVGASASRSACDVATAPNTPFCIVTILRAA